MSSEEKNLRSHKFPKGKKGLKRKLREEKQLATWEIKRAMKEASQALDEQIEEINVLKRILISERAQVIYYSDKYVACLRGECIDLKPENFLNLDEKAQTAYVKRAVVELSEAQTQTTATVAKRIVI